MIVLPNNIEDSHKQQNKGSEKQPSHTALSSLYNGQKLAQLTYCVYLLKVGVEKSLEGSV